jgi:hypothetical protein
VDANMIYCSSCGAANTVGARFCSNCGTPIQSAQNAEPVSTGSAFITLACPNCGGKLEITPDIERFACKFCGMEHLVKRAGDEVSLAPVVEGLKRVEAKFDQVLTGSDRLAAEQTIQRLKGEIPELEKQVKAKETLLNAILPRPGLHRAAIGLTNLGTLAIALVILVFIFFKTGIFEGVPAIERFLKANYTPHNWIISIAAGLACILIGSILVRASRARRVVRVNPKHMNAFEKQLQQGTEELTRLKADLEARKQQLEQLHRYTAER